MTDTHRPQVRKLLDRLGPYEQHDLVALGEAGLVGVIVECGPDSCRVMTNRGTPDRPELRTARLPDIKRKLLMRNAVSNDQGLNPVRESVTAPAVRLEAM